MDVSECLRNKFNILNKLLNLLYFSMVYHRIIFSVKLMNTDLDHLGYIQLITSIAMVG